MPSANEENLSCLLRFREREGERARERRRLDVYLRNVAHRTQRLSCSVAAASIVFSVAAAQLHLYL